MTDDEMQVLARMNDWIQPGTFQHFLGVRVTEAGFDHLTAILEVRDDHTNQRGVMHGGALMSLADTLGALATRMILKPGQETSTLESKTNFLRAVVPGATLTARAEALHIGRSTMVWQTTIRDESGRAVVVTTQTQMILRGN